MPNSPVTPLKIATWGHVAEIIKTQLAARKMSTPELATAIGTSSAAIYNWVRCQNAPSEKYQKAMAKIFDLPVKDFRPRGITTSAKPKQEVAIITSRATDVLSFTVNNEGTCRLRLDAVLSLDHGIPLFRVLLDSGLVRKDTHE